MSYTAPNSRPYKSSAWTDAALSGQAKPKYPLPQDCPIQLAAYAFDQDYQLSFTAFGSSSPFVKNAIASSCGLSDANAILTAISQPNDGGGELATFTATFHRVPASWDDFTQTMPFTYPSFPGTITAAVSAGAYSPRTGFTEKVPVRIRRDYFVLDPNGVLNGGVPISIGTAPASGTVNDSGGSPVQIVGSLADIPRITKSKFLSCDATGTPIANLVTNYISPVGGVGNDVGFYPQTLPAWERYTAWATRAQSIGANKGWLSAAWNGTSDTAGTYGQLIAEDSNPEPYAGNIVCRTSIYVLAK